MRRREFISLMGAAALAGPLPAHAQQPVRRIGVLMAFAADDPEGQARLAAFVEGLRQLGWTDGRNVKIEIRWPVGDAARSRSAEELVALAPDVILASIRQRGGVAADYSQRANRVCELSSIRLAQASSQASRGRAATQPDLARSNTA